MKSFKIYIAKLHKTAKAAKTILAIAKSLKGWLMHSKQFLVFMVF